MKLETIIITSEGKNNYRFNDQKNWQKGNVQRSIEEGGMESMPINQGRHIQNAHSPSHRAWNLVSKDTEKNLAMEGCTSRKINVTLCCRNITKIKTTGAASFFVVILKDPSKPQKSPPMTEGGKAIFYSFSLFISSLEFLWICSVLFFFSPKPCLWHCSL